MAAEIQWIFITDKYTLVEIIDNSIVVARFNQKELLRPLIETRCKILETKSYEEVILVLDPILEINEEITDKRLKNEIGRLIDRISSFKENRYEFKDKIEKVESRASD